MPEPVVSAESPEVSTKPLAAPEDVSESELVAYQLWEPALPLVPAGAQRGWMSATPDRFAYRCLPLVVANQSGWFILSDRGLEIWWDGGPGPASIQIRDLSSKDKRNCPSSHFGGGVVTWSIPYVFRTPPGYDLIVRGPTNWCKDGISPLDGVVETDWSAAPFTINWKVTRPNWPLRFEEGEPIAMILPAQRGCLSSIQPCIRPINEAPELSRLYRLWKDHRDRSLRHNSAVRGAYRKSWDRHYWRGVSVGNTEIAAEHRVGLQLRQFALQPPPQVTAELPAAPADLSSDGQEMPNSGDLVVGEWVGLLSLPQGDFSLLLKIEEDQGFLQGLLDIPGQMETAVAVDAIIHAGGALRFAIYKIRLYYEGELEGEEFHGALFQNGVEMPI
jgi:hypothetical protein